MVQNREILQKLLAQLPPITLEEMKNIRLMKRTDCKYLTNIPALMELLRLAQGSYYVQDIDGRRISTYTTTYWDGEERHEMFRTHHCGHRPRTKVRVRTYIESQMTFLEIKKKNNHNKTSKKRIAVPSVETVINDRAGEDFLTEHTGYTFDDIVPTLRNHFHRITLVNLDKTERLTIDFGLSFYNHETGQEAEMDNVVIIELKRDGRVHSPVLAMLRKLRIKPAGFSKYCIGSSVTNSSLPQNRFKKRLVRIRKVTEKPAPVVTD